MNHQDYCRAVDNLERLVVMRLFELTKLNHSSTAYKMRRHIQKQLAVRSEAIKTALKKYNRAARLLDPPRQPLEISTILEYAFLGEFDLLRDSREDVRTKPWACPINREYTQRYFKIQCAREEIVRLNVEIRRLITSMEDDKKFYPSVISRLQVTNPYLAHAINKRWDMRQALNLIHTTQIQKIYALSGFSGNPRPGKQVSIRNHTLLHPPTLESSVPSPQIPSLPTQQPLENVTVDEDPSQGEISEDDEIIRIANAFEEWDGLLD